MAVSKTLYEDAIMVLLMRGLVTADMIKDPVITPYEVLLIGS